MRQISEKVIIRLVGSYYKGCCASCHDDRIELGYHMIDIELGKGRWAEVCCYVYDAYKKWLENNNPVNPV
jgi:hypothetical protein